MRNLILLSLISFFQDMSSEAIFPLITFLIGSFGAQYLGIMEAIAEITSNILKLKTPDIYRIHTFNAGKTYVCNRIYAVHISNRKVC